MRRTVRSGGYPRRAITLIASTLLLGCDAAVPAFDAGPLDGLPTWTVVRQLEIGREDDRNYALTPVGGLAISPGGEVFLSQPQDRHIRVFDPHGQFLRTIGRRGEGPGEFLRLGEIGFLGDTLWAVDIRQAGFLHFFTADGQPLRMRRVPAPERPYLGSSRYYPLPDGGVLMSTATAGDLLREEHEQPWLRWDGNNSLVSRLPGNMVSAVRFLEYDVVIAGRTVPNRIGVIPPLSTKSWLALAPDGSAITRIDYRESSSVHEVMLRLARYTPVGDTVATASFPVLRQPIPSEVADSLLEAEVARVGRETGNEARARRMVVEVFRVPRAYPPVGSLFVDANGRSWIRLEDTAEPRWLVLNPDFSLLAWVDLPARFRVMAGAGDTLWGIELDQFDVPTVVKYQLRRAG